MTIDTDVRDVRLTLAGLLDERMPLAAVRQAAESPTGYDEELWRELARDFGICEMHVPAGTDGPVEAAMLWAVAEVFGARLAALPYLSTVVLASLPLLRSARSSSGEELLLRLLAGDGTATFADPEQGWRLRDGRLHGVAGRVLHGMDSEWILTVHEDTLLGVCGERGVTRRRLDPVDPTRPAAEVRFSGAPFVELGDVTEETLLRRRLDLMTYLAHESAGGVRRVKDMAVDYVKVRRQFGRPIGSFQAMKHLSADLAIDTMAASAAARRAAAEAAGDGHHEAALQAHLYTSAAYIRAARAALHAHGGIGFTWEFDSHLYYRRAYASSVLAGRPSDLRRELAGRLLATRGS